MSVWIKRNKNLDERQREKNLREEAEEKNLKRTEIEKKKFYWRVSDMRLRKCFIQEKEEEVEKPQQQQQVVEVMKGVIN